MKHLTNVTFRRQITRCSNV